MASATRSTCHADDANILTQRSVAFFQSGLIKGFFLNEACYFCIIDAKDCGACFVACYDVGDDDLHMATICIANCSSFGSCS